MIFPRLTHLEPRLCLISERGDASCILGDRFPGLWRSGVSFIKAYDVNKLKRIHFSVKQDILLIRPSSLLSIPPSPPDLVGGLQSHLPSETSSPLQSTTSRPFRSRIPNSKQVRDISKCVSHHPCSLLQRLQPQSSSIWPSPLPHRQ